MYLYSVTLMLIVFLCLGLLQIPTKVNYLTKSRPIQYTSPCHFANLPNFLQDLENPEHAADWTQLL